MPAINYRSSSNSCQDLRYALFGYAIHVFHDVIQITYPLTTLARNPRQSRPSYEDSRPLCLQYMVHLPSHLPPRSLCSLLSAAPTRPRSLCISCLASFAMPPKPPPYQDILHRLFATTSHSTQSQQSRSGQGASCVSNFFKICFDIYVHGLSSSPRLPFHHTTSIIFTFEFLPCPRMWSCRT